MRQNLIIVLLSVVATLLLVLVLRSPQQAVGQNAGGGTAMAGEMLCATGNLPGGAAGSAFWIYDPKGHKLAVYYLSNGGLEIKAVRDTGYDMEAYEFSAQGLKQTPTYAVMKKAVTDQAKRGAAAAEKAAKTEKGKKPVKGGKEEPAEEPSEEEGK